MAAQSRPIHGRKKNPQAPGGNRVASLASSSSRPCRCGGALATAPGLRPPAALLGDQAPERLELEPTDRSPSWSQIVATRDWTVTILQGGK
ncbi:unnamed protein product [Urochloa humidicola]